MRSRRTTSPSVIAAALAAAMTVAVVGLTVPVGAFAAPTMEDSGLIRPKPQMRVTLLADEFAGTIGATIGPDGALYVAEGALGRIRPELKRVGWRRFDVREWTPDPGVDPPRGSDRPRVRRKHAVRVGDPRRFGRRWKQRRRHLSDGCIGGVQGLRGISGRGRSRIRPPPSSTCRAVSSSPSSPSRMGSS